MGSSSSNSPSNRHATAVCGKNPVTKLVTFQFFFFTILYKYRGMVFNTTFNNISVISWGSVLLVEETEVPRENHGPAASH